MSQRALSSMGSTILVVAIVLSGSAVAVAQSETPTTAWGQPDLSGTWDFRTITPLQRPEDLADKEFLTEAEAAGLEQEVIQRNEELLNRDAIRTTAGGNVDRGEDGAPGFYNNLWLDRGTSTIETRRTSLITDPPNGRLPELTPEGQERADARREYLREHPADSWLDRTPYDRCILGFNAGPPITPAGYNQNLAIFQTADEVALLTEMVHTVRVVPLDGRAALGDDMRQWSGDARGHWEGNTLVVESTNFSDERRWRGTTANMRLIERFTRIDEKTLEYEFTVIDPETWVSPWTASIPMQKTDAPLLEYACHEGNYAMPNILGGHRQEERAASVQH